MTNEHEEYQPTNVRKVKQMPGWENLSDEMAESISNMVKKFAELFYITIARDMSLNPVPETEALVKERKFKIRKKRTKIKD
jgi:hypothetical protein